jgi:hypothetical protein
MFLSPLRRLRNRYTRRNAHESRETPESEKPTKKGLLHDFSRGKSDRLSVAPMMDWTD